MIKVKNTWKHKHYYPDPRIAGDGCVYHEIVVTEGKLVFIKCEEDNAILLRYKDKLTNSNNNSGLTVDEWNASENLIPILISKTEVSDVGDNIYNHSLGIIYYNIDKESLEFLCSESFRSDSDKFYKILVLGHQFSEKNIEAMIDGSINEFTPLLVECESDENWDDGSDSHFIKLTPTCRLIFEEPRAVNSRFGQINISMEANLYNPQLDAAYKYINEKHSKNISSEKLADIGNRSSIALRDAFLAGIKWKEEQLKEKYENQNS